MRSLKRSVWCSMLTSSQYLTRMTPESMMARSTAGVYRRKVSTSSSG